MKLTVEQIQKAAKEELAHLSTAALYLYGSHAKGLARPDSDVDLGVLAAAPLDRVDLFNAQLQLASRLGVPVDLVDLRVVSPVLRVQVIAAGRPFMTADETIVQRFEMDALSSYADLNQSRREILALYGR